MSNSELRNAYAQKAISQIPRLLTHMDRNSFSPTYGCMHRDFWLYKTSDFPDAVRQFGVHALALVYKHDFPGSIYKGHHKMKEWTIAAMEYWTSIQHKDGSFDEFYPYERGWVGPTAFTMFTVAEAYNLMVDELTESSKSKIKNAIKKAAYFIAKGESEEDHLANHHAMACLAVWKAYEILEDENLKEGFNRLWTGFLSYHNHEEGWSREYDGVDPGYLSATVSFLAKIYKTNPDRQIRKVIKESIEFSSYFAYPNGFYAGSLGSRNTLHFYPHGYEIMGQEIPIAQSIAEKMLKGLSEDKLVPPEIMSDRYLFYRVPEFLVSYLDYTPRKEKLELLPYEALPSTYFFKYSKIFSCVRNKSFILCNLAKGGVIKAFNTENNKLIFNDCGIVGTLNNGKVVTSQWIDDSYNITTKKEMWEVSGKMNIVPSNKLFTPFKHIVFRTVLVMIGWIPKMAHIMKGQIRKSLILGQRQAPVSFTRKLSICTESIILKDTIKLDKNTGMNSLSIGDEFFVRYVPQSRFFQHQELEVKGFNLEKEQLELLNTKKQLVVQQTVDLKTGDIKREIKGN